MLDLEPDCLLDCFAYIGRLSCWKPTLSLTGVCSELANRRAELLHPGIQNAQDVTTLGE